MRTVLVTNVIRYTGPSAIGALLKQHVPVVCHDRTFGERAIRDAFRDAHPGSECLEGTDPISLIEELKAREPLCPAKALHAARR